jgi:hypothetical protein
MRVLSCPASADASGLDEYTYEYLELTRQTISSPHMHQCTNSDC